MSDRPFEAAERNPLADLDEWEAFLQERYPQPGEKSSFRDYGTNVRPAVREFYRLNHRHQTLDFVCAKERQYLDKNHRVMGIWEAMEFLDTFRPCGLRSMGAKVRRRQTKDGSRQERTNA